VLFSLHVLSLSPMLSSSPAFPFCRAPLALGLALAFPLALPFTASAQPTEAPREQPPLPKVSVTATRTERAADEVPATVTVIGREALAERDGRDLKAVLDDEVDLAVRSQQPRFTAAGSSTGRPGNEGLNIRGLEGNQVLLLLDGVPLPAAFSFGPFATGRLDSVDVDLLSRAEVLRGPSSSQFGSDGLAGALALTLLRPQDLLVDGKTSAGFVKLGGNSVDSSTNFAAAYALASGPWQGLVAVSHRRGHEVDNQGDNDRPYSDRTAPNPLDHQATSLLGSVGYQLDPRHRLELTLDARRREQQVDVLSAVAEVPAPPSQSNPFANQTVSLTADDEVERQRLSVVHRYSNADAPFLTQWTTHLFGQRAEVHQFTAEDRAFSADRTRDNTYQERTLGLASQAQAVLRGAVPQRLSFGLDLSQTSVEGERDGTVPPFGETFPSKPFPDTRFRKAGAFVQSEIDTESFTLIPALRFDKYSLAPTSTNGFSGETVSLSDQAVTPRLGAIWRVSNTFAPYAQWALGFRAPQPDQVNNGFTNFASGYKSIGNPDLKPEHARSIELGARGQLDVLRWQLAWFDNRYRDFISQEMVGIDPDDGLMTFRYVNLTDARIRGAELRLEWKPAGPWSGQFALARTQGSSEVSGVREPLTTIQPLRARLALRYEAGPWNLMAQWQHAEGKAAKDVPSDSRETQFLPPSSDVVDLFATWRLDSTWSLRGALLNAFDETYWRWSDVRGLSDSPSIVAYSAPGRSVQVAVRADF
jgi:hemoglobin/transferrin/lactoferrin receptor protein